MSQAHTTGDRPELIELGEAVDSAKTRKERKEAKRAYIRKEERAVMQELAHQAQELVTKPKRGRPSIYTEELGLEICERLSAGQSLNQICKLQHMPSMPAIWDWIRKDPSFAFNYARAREDMAHALFDESLAIADDTSLDMIPDSEGNLTANPTAVARAKLRIDTRFRIAGKISPRVYGERIESLSAVNVQVNSVTVDARQLEPDQRDKLRQLLLTAKASTIDSSLE